MSILSDSIELITRVDSLKTTLVSALQNKGVAVDPTIKLKDFPALIESIEVGGGITEKTYLYTITGQTSSAYEPYINGDYYEVTGNDIPQALQALGTPTQYPVYTNGYGIFLFVYDSYGTGANYNIGYVYGESSSQVQYLYINIASTITPVGSGSYSILSGYGWTGTVKEYSNSGESGGGSEGGGNTNIDTINVSGFATVYYPSMDGDYNYDSANNRYVNKDGYKIQWIEPGSGYDYNPSTAQWCIIDSGMTVMVHLGGTKDDITSIAGTKNYAITVDTYTPQVTITVGGSSSGGSSNADYVVSGAVSYPEVNGEYVEDGTAEGKPKYVNTANSNAVIQWSSILGWAVFYMGQPRYSTMDTSGATPPVSANWTHGGTESVTVSKGGGNSKKEEDTATCYSCAKVFEYDPAEGTPMCPHCGMPQ